jgi:acyl-coenzyme A thioesterase PaaI-like protein
MLTMSGQQHTFLDNDFCFACGGKNPLGLHLDFYLDGDAFCTRAMPKPHWQGFAGVVHGGILSTIIDDLMSNHLFRVQGVWTATADLTLRFRRPVPLDQELLFTSRVESQHGKIWTLSGVCVTAAEPDAQPLTTAAGRFVEVPVP